MELKRTALPTMEALLRENCQSRLLLGIIKIAFRTVTEMELRLGLLGHFIDQIDMERFILIGGVRDLADNGATKFFNSEVEVYFRGNQSKSDCDSGRNCLPQFNPVLNLDADLKTLTPGKAIFVGCLARYSNLLNMSLKVLTNGVGF